MILIAGLTTNISLSQITYSKYLDNTCEWNIYKFAGFLDANCGSITNNVGEYEIFYQTKSGFRHSFIKYYIDGDTLIINKWYYKLYLLGRDSIVCPDTTKIKNYTRFFMAIREDYSKRIYYYHAYGNTERLLWDFNIEMGDTIRKNCVIEKIDTIWLGTMPLKRFYCSCSDNNIIIEGVGANTGLFNPYYCSLLFEGGRRLISFKRQNNLLQISNTDK